MIPIYEYDLLLYVQDCINCHPSLAVGKIGKDISHREVQILSANYVNYLQASNIMRSAEDGSNHKSRPRPLPTCHN